MALLHPYYLVPFIIILFLSFSEVYSDKKPSLKYLIPIAAWLIIVTGFRDGVGPDYGSYRNIYLWYSSHIDYIEIIKKALHLESGLDMEWLYILINKLIFDIFNAPPFYMVTFIIALITIPLNYINISEKTYYPYTTIALFFFPSFFIGENGQIRQCLGTIISYFAIRYIVRDELWKYLICIYLASGIHNACILFLPMYWVAKIPINKTIMILLIVVSIILSPLKVYEYFGSLLNSFAAESNLAIGYENYINVKAGERINGAFGIPEGNMLIILCILFFFDTSLVKKYPYYEYMRNYSIIGICFFFIFRESPVFSSRLTGIFVTSTGFLIPFCIYTAPPNTKKLLHLLIVFLVLFNFAVFSSFKTIVNGNFTFDSYKNVILP